MRIKEIADKVAEEAKNKSKKVESSMEVEDLDLEGLDKNITEARRGELFRKGYSQAEIDKIHS